VVNNAKMGTQRNIVLHPLQQVFGEDFNPKLFFVTIKRNWIWMILLFLIPLCVAFLYLRYTPRIYETSATVMIKSENPARALNLEDIALDNQSQELFSEIEMMKSNVIIKRVIGELPLKVTYLKLGEMLNNELYKSSPFRVEYKIRQSSIYNTRVNVTYDTNTKIQVQ
jgi:hypothetical protein